MVYGAPMSSNAAPAKPFLKALAGETQPVPPLWLMRQAGRYLPEYRQLRETAGSFQAMVYSPAFATEVTLQPIRRFGFDAAILFSDILVIPEALGQEVRFEDGHGPRLSPLAGIPEIDPTKWSEKLAPVIEAVKYIKAGLERENFHHTALIGFAGSPFTVACYMVDGSGASKDFPKTRTMAYTKPEEFTRLIDVLVATTTAYLSTQIQAGAEAVQLFDSWAGVLPPAEFRRWVIEPTKRIVTMLKASHPGVPIIGFPRGAGLMAEEYIRETGVTAVGLDTSTDLTYASTVLQPLCPVQGCLDPFALMAGGDSLENAVKPILERLRGKPFIFNLGHGIHKDTPPEHVKLLVDLVRSGA